jgi:hypothetical protein
MTVLTKRVHLAQDGTIANDSTDCRMSRGIMHRTSLPDWRDFAAVIEETPNNVAYALGTMRADLPASIHLVAKVEPQSEKPGFATRTRGTIQYRDEPGLVLLDFDTKGIPEDVRARLRSLGGFCAAIEAVCAGIALAGYIRRSQRAPAYFIVRRARRIVPAASTFMFLSRTSRTDGAEPLAAKHQAIPRVKPGKSGKAIGGRTVVQQACGRPASDGSAVARVDRNRSRGRENRFEPQCMACRG